MRISSQLLLTFLLNACWQIALIAALASSAHGCCATPSRVINTGFG